MELVGSKDGVRVRWSFRFALSSCWLGSASAAWASLVSQIIRVCLPRQRPGLDPWLKKILLEKGMATHSSILAWRIPWTEVPGKLQSMGSQRVGHDSATNTGLILSC